MAKITLWGDLAHVLTEKVIGKRTTVVVTSTMVLVYGIKVNFFLLLYDTFNPN
jgi:hypothetical protein